MMMASPPRRLLAPLSILTLVCLFMLPSIVSGSDQMAGLRARGDAKPTAKPPQQEAPQAPGPPPVTLQFDDGSPEVNIGIVEQTDPGVAPDWGVQAVFLNRFTP